MKIDEFDIKKLEIKVKSGGPIYIENLYTKEEQNQNIRIYIEGGILFPLFRINDDEENFKKILNNYIQLYNKDVNTYYNIIYSFISNNLKNKIFTIFLNSIKKIGIYINSSIK